MDLCMTPPPPSAPESVPGEGEGGVSGSTTAHAPPWSPIWKFIPYVSG